MPLHCTCNPIHRSLSGHGILPSLVQIKPYYTPCPCIVPVTRFIDPCRGTAFCHLWYKSNVILRRAPTRKHSTIFGTNQTLFYAVPLPANIPPSLVQIKRDRTPCPYPQTFHHLWLIPNVITRRAPTRKPANP